MHTGILKLIYVHDYLSVDDHTVGRNAKEDVKIYKK